MTFCPYCGTQNPPDAKFCVSCGEQLPREPSYQVAYKPAQAPAKPMPPIQTSMPPPTQNYSPQPPMTASTPAYNQAYTQVTPSAIPPELKAMKKSEGLAVVLSFFIPGAGHMYAGKIGKGVLILLFFFIGYMFFVIPGIVIWIWAMIDADKVTKKYNLFILRHGRRPTSLEY